MVIYIYELKYYIFYPVGESTCRVSLAVFVKKKKKKKIKIKGSMI